MNKYNRMMCGETSPKEPFKRELQEYEELLTSEGETDKEEKRDACRYLLDREQPMIAPSVYADDQSVGNEKARRIFKALEKDGIVNHYERSIDETGSEAVTKQEALYYLTHPESSGGPTKLILDHHDQISKRESVGMRAYDDRVMKVVGIAFIFNSLALILLNLGVVDVVIMSLTILGLATLAIPLSAWIIQWLVDKQYLTKHPMS